MSPTCSKSIVIFSKNVYEWAGCFRTVDIAKKLFEGQHLRGLNQEAFARRGAEILGTLNAVHPFREGNGRTQREFLRVLAHKNGYWVDWSKVSRHKLYDASDASFMRGENTLFEELPKKAIELIG